MAISELVFEKAYCEYRLNRTDEALRTLTAVKDPDARMKELLAQVVSGTKYSRCVFDEWQGSTVWSILSAKDHCILALQGVLVTMLECMN